MALKSISAKSISAIIAMALVIVFMMAGTAWANHDPDTSTTIDPHAGYSTTTDFCLQCHDIHDAGGDYALMRNQTVTATCATCHGVYVIDPGSWPLPEPTGAYDPGYGGTTASVAVDIAFGSQSHVYDIPADEKYTHEGHRLGQGLNASATVYEYADSTETTDTAAYIPGGSSLLSRIPSWSYWKSAYFDTSLPAISAPPWDAANESTSAGGGTNALGGLYCGSCHALHGDKADTGYGNSLPESVFPDTSMNNKLLSAIPNHTTPTLESVVTTWTSNGFYWCARCHDERLEVVTQTGTSTGGEPWYTTDGTGTHNHPSSYCLQCHANPYIDVGSTETPSDDFPHSSSRRNLLFKVPDALCLYCHVSGTLP